MLPSPMGTMFDINVPLVAEISHEHHTGYVFVICENLAHLRQNAIRFQVNIAYNQCLRHTNLPIGSSIRSEEQQTFASLWS